MWQGGVLVPVEGRALAQGRHQRGMAGNTGTGGSNDKIQERGRSVAAAGKSPWLCSSPNVVRLSRGSLLRKLSGEKSPGENSRLSVSVVCDLNV